MMRTVKNILLILCFITTLILSGSVYASSIVTGTTIESKKSDEKYTLKNLGSLAHKTATFYSLKCSLEFKGFTNSTLGSNNYLKYNKGNISYVIPYRYKIILPRFKTPTAPAQ